MYDKLPLPHTPVSQRAEEIFSAVTPGSITLLEAATGSGKSLVSPIAVQQKLNAMVLVLVPSVDVARDNAHRIVKLGNKNWRLGVEVGYAAGGTYVHGQKIMVATYGAYLSNTKLRHKKWGAILLDESHVEQWQVEVARSDIKLLQQEEPRLAVMELSATLNTEKVTAYWGAGGRKVKHIKIDLPGTAYTKVLREIAVGSIHQEDIAEVCAKQALERLMAGDQLIMVTQPGQREVEACAEKIIELFEKLDDEQMPDFEFEIATYHGDTDPSEVRSILARVTHDKPKIIVTTPRLLTGFNHEDLDSVITDGYAKYQTCAGGFATSLRRGHMSKGELTQALGRVGRFKDGILILCSDMLFQARPPVMTPEVERISSLPLALGLLELGRNPLEIEFCNTPRDLNGSLGQLAWWGFTDDVGKITDAGRFANQLGIRPDLAHFLSNVMADKSLSTTTKAAAIILAAVQEGNGVTRPKQKGEMREVHEPAPVIDGSSFVFNEAHRFLKALQVNEKKEKFTWVSWRGVSRIKAIICRLIAAFEDEDLNHQFTQILSNNVAGKNEKEKEVARRKKWGELGGRIERSFTDNCQHLLRHLTVTAGPAKLFVFERAFRGGHIGRNCFGDEYLVAHFIGTMLEEGDLFFGEVIEIDGRNGRKVTLLAQGTCVNPEQLVNAQPGVYTFEEEAFSENGVAQSVLSIEGTPFVRYTDEEVGSENWDIAALFDDIIEPVT